MSTGKPKDGDLKLVEVLEPDTVLPPRPPVAPGSTVIVEYMAPVKEEEKDLEVKLRQIIENVPVRVSSTSGSSVGSGSGDFHQYRQMRQKEQDRLARMDVDYQRRKEVAEFNIRREERMKAANRRTAKRRLKRQKKKERRGVKRMLVEKSSSEQKSCQTTKGTLMIMMMMQQNE